MIKTIKNNTITETSSVKPCATPILTAAAHAMPTVFSGDTFETCNRALEGFLFHNGIRHTRFHQDAFGSTIWVYENTEALRRFVQLYVEQIKLRKSMKGGAC